MNKSIQKTTQQNKAAVAEYLKQPYARCVMPESDGTYRGEIIEFPGCFAVGQTAEEALANLEVAAESWLEAVTARGQRVPDPIDTGPFSGKLVVRLPKSLHKKAANIAARENTSLNQFIVTCISECVGQAQHTPRFQYATGWQNVSTFNANFNVYVGWQPYGGTYQELAGTAGGSRNLLSVLTPNVPVIPGPKYA